MHCKLYLVYNLSLVTEIFSKYYKYSKRNSEGENIKYVVNGSLLQVFKKETSKMMEKQQIWNPYFDSKNKEDQEETANVRS